MLIAFAVLAITLASLLAAGLPLITAFIGVAIGIAGVKALSGVVDLSETAPALASMLGLAVGIDYALFILSRHRQHLGEGMGVRESAARATATAGSAVVFAGLTVVIALAGLTVVGIPFLTVMGLAAAGTVAIAVLIAITLLPAILGFAGAAHQPREPRPRLPAVAAFAPSARDRERALGDVRHPPPAGGAARRPDAAVRRRGAGAAHEAGAARRRLAADVDHRAAFLRPAHRRLRSWLQRPADRRRRCSELDSVQQSELAKGVVKGLEEMPGVAEVSAPATNPKGDLTIVSVTPTSGPASEATKDLVSLMRAKADEIPSSSGVEAFVTGTTALNIDTADRLGAALPKYVAVVVGLALLLLMVVFRSILVPVKAAAGFLLSIGASMGLVVWVFQDGHLNDLLGVSQAGPIVSFLPVLLIGILFGLAMDYEVFLVSRMREHFLRSGRPRESIIVGYGQSGRVVTAAAAIMIAVFGAYILDPDPVLKSIGLSLAIGVLADAFVVRMTLVPAVMALLGHHAWRLPRRLERFVPSLDIEGERLAKSPA